MSAMEAALPAAANTITFAGVPYRGVFSEISTADMPELGGFGSDVTATFTVRKSVMPTPPQSGDTITRGGVPYAVEKVADEVASWTINLKDPAK